MADYSELHPFDWFLNVGKRVEEETKARDAQQDVQQTVNEKPQAETPSSPASQAKDFRQALASKALQVDAQQRMENAVATANTQQQIDQQNTKVQTVVNADTSTISLDGAVSTPAQDREMAGVVAPTNPLDAPPVQTRGVYEQRIATDTQQPLGILSRFKPASRESVVQDTRNVQQNDEWFRKQGKAGTKVVAGSSAVQEKPITGSETKTELDAQAQRVFSKAEAAVDEAKRARQAWIDNLSVPNDPRSRAIMAAFYDWKIKGPTVQQQAALQLYDQELQRCNYKYSLMAQRAKQDPVIAEAVNQKAQYEMMQNDVRTVTANIARYNGNIINATPMGKLYSQMTEAERKLAEGNATRYAEDIRQGNIKDTTFAKSLANGLYTNVKHGRLDAVTGYTMLDELSSVGAFGDEYEETVSDLKNLGWTDMAARRGAMVMVIDGAKQSFMEALAGNQLAPTALQFMQTMFDDQNVNQLAKIARHRKANTDKMNAYFNSIVQKPLARALTNDSLLESLQNVRMNNDYVGSAMFTVSGSGDRNKAAQYFREGIDGMMASGDATTRVAGQYISGGVDNVKIADAVADIHSVNKVFADEGMNNVLSSLLASFDSASGILPENKEAIKELTQLQINNLINAYKADNKELDVVALLKRAEIAKDVSIYKDMNELVTSLSSAQLKQLLPVVQEAVINATKSSMVFDTKKYGNTPTARITKFCAEYGLDPNKLTQTQLNGIANGFLRLPTNVLVYNKLHARAQELADKYQSAKQAAAVNPNIQVAEPTEQDLLNEMFTNIHELSGYVVLARGMNIEQSASEALRQEMIAAEKRMKMAQQLASQAAVQKK